MRSLSFFVAAWALPVIGLAQQSPSPTAPEKDAVATLRQHLRDTAAAGPTSFDVRWQPMWSTATLAGGRPRPEPDSAKGSFGPDWLLVEQQSGKQRAWLQAGRHTVTRSKGEAWQLCNAREARVDGLDPQLLLRVLAANTSAIAARTIVERGGVPVEQITVCLDQTQSDALTSAGAILEASAAQAIARSLVKSGRAELKDSPVPVVDACIDIDVATHRVRRVYVRSMCKDVDMRELMAGAARRRPGTEVPEAAADPAPQAPAPQAAAPAASPAPALPKEFKDGLPVRDETGLQVVWLEVVMHDHGKAAALVLDETQKLLLGR